MLFSLVSDAVRNIMNKNGHNALMNYIDDLIYCGLPSNIGHSYQFLLNLLQELGLDISAKNCALVVQSCICCISKYVEHVMRVQTRQLLPKMSCRHYWDYYCISRNVLDQPDIFSIVCFSF